jgi:hypothetical protein
MQDKKIGTGKEEFLTDAYQEKCEADLPKCKSRQFIAGSQVPVIDSLNRKFIKKNPG